MTSPDSHYLKQELYQLVREDPEIFDFLQNGSLDGIWYWDLENPEHEWMSARFWEVFGYDPKEKPQKADAWQDMIDPDDLKVALDNFNKHCAKPEHPYDQIVRYQHKSGSTVWVRCRGMAIRDELGTPIRMLGAHTELTALKNAEIALQNAHDELENRVEERTAELIATTQMLEQRNRELQDFVFAASHDLKEPLRKIQAFGDRLRSKTSEGIGEDGRDYLERMQKSASRMQNLIDDLLDFSRVSTIEQHFDAVDLQAVAADVVTDLEARIEETGGHVEVSEVPSIEADGLQMRQLLQNLIGNALKFRRAELAPIVQVRGRNTDDDGLCQITVEDNGIGFDERYLDKIFTPFQRLQGPQEFEGTGMGLAICRKIVERHGGTIGARSTPGQGSVFVVELPSKHSTDQ